MLTARLRRLATFKEPMPVIDTSGIDAATVQAMSDDDAFNELCRRRWPTGAPCCPKCGRGMPYFLAKRKRFKCWAVECAHQFTPTSGTVFASHKIGHRDLLLMMAYEGPQLGQDIVNQKSALDIKRRIAASRKAQARTLSGNT